MILQLHTYFNQIDDKYYHLYLEQQEKLTNLKNGEFDWKFDKYSENENKQIGECYQLIEEYCIVSLLFRHISIEGFINDIGIRYLDKNDYIDIEMKPFLDKICLIHFNISNKNFPKDQMIYSKLSDLNTTRNTFVHMKSGEISLEALMHGSDDEFFSLINNMFGNKKKKNTKQKYYVNVLEETVGLYDDLSLIFLNLINSK